MLKGQIYKQESLCAWVMATSNYIRVLVHGEHREHYTDIFMALPVWWI